MQCLYGQIEGAWMFIVASLHADVDTTVGIGMLKEGHERNGMRSACGGTASGLGEWCVCGSADGTWLFFAGVSNGVSLERVGIMLDGYRGFMSRVEMMATWLVIGLMSSETTRSSRMEIVTVRPAGSGTSQWSTV